MKKEIYTVAFLIVLTLTGMNYFYATFLPEAFKAFKLVFLAIVVSLGLVYSFRETKGFNLPMQLLIFAMILSIFMAYLSWDQPIYLGFLVTLPYLIWPIYFVLLRMKIDITLLERVIMGFGVLYCISYFYQFFNPTNVLFNFGMVGEEYREVRGIIRIIFPGVGVFWLAVVISLSRVTHGTKHPYFYFIFICLGLLLPIMQATRTFIVPTFIIYFFHFAKHLSFGKKAFISFIFAIGFLLVASIIDKVDIPVFQGLIDQQKKTMDDGTKDIRFVAAHYYAFELSPSFVNQIFGNGIGHERSSYGQFIKFLYSKGLFISDIGIIGIYAWFGVIPIIAWIIIAYKLYNYRLPPKFQYVKYYFFFVYFGALTGGTFYHINNILTSVYAFYIFQSVMYSKKIQWLEKLKKLNKEDLLLLKKMAKQ